MNPLPRYGLACLVLLASVGWADDAPPGLPNFHQVAPGIYRGGAPTDEGLKSLQDLGIRTIIDLRIESARKQEQEAAEGLGFKWISLRMGREAPTEEQLETFLGTVTDQAAQPVFVHCQHGADRAGAMCGIYRVVVDGWTFNQAWDEMRRYGFKSYLSELKQSVRAAADNPKALAGFITPEPAPQPEPPAPAAPAAAPIQAKPLEPLGNRAGRSVAVLLILALGVVVVQMARQRRP